MLKKSGIQIFLKRRFNLPLHDLSGKGSGSGSIQQYFPVHEDKGGEYHVTKAGIAKTAFTFTFTRRTAKVKNGGKIEVTWPLAFTKTGFLSSSLVSSSNAITTSYVRRRRNCRLFASFALTKDTNEQNAIESVYVACACICVTSGNPALHNDGGKGTRKPLQNTSFHNCFKLLLI